MKNRVRVAGLMLAAVLAIGMTGCAKKQTAEEVYKSAMEKTNALTAIDMTMEGTIGMAAEGETMDVTLEMDAKMQNLNQEDMRMDMAMNVGMAGISMDIHAYYADGYYLMEMMGQKLKYPMTLEEAMNQAAVMNEMAVDTLSELTMTEENGVKKLSYSVDIAKLSETTSSEEYLAVLEGLGLGGADESIQYQSMDGTVTVNKEGYVSETTVHMVYTTDIEGTEVSNDVQLNIIYNNPGQAVEVEIPDASEYTEIDPSLLG